MSPQEEERFRLAKAIKAADKNIVDMDWEYVLPRATEMAVYQEEVPLPIIDCYKSEEFFKNGKYQLYVLIKHQSQGYERRKVNGHIVEGYTTNAYPYALLHYINGMFYEKSPNNRGDHDEEYDEDEMIAEIFHNVSSKVNKP